MAISTNTILGSILWAKKFNFNKPSGIGNELEPAKTSANIVMQTILGPPFTWWWNNEELALTCNPTPATANTTGSPSLTANVLTLPVVTTIGVQQGIILSAYTTLTQLNGQYGIVLTNTGSAITVQIQLPNFAATADTGKITAVTTQDYSILVPEFSHIEHASVLDLSKTPPVWMQLEVKGNLALETKTTRPQFIEPHIEDAAGNVTFRVAPAPNLAYPLAIHIQKAAPLVTSLNQTWAPIPDFLAYIYNYGFLALMWSFADDPRAQMASQKFVTHLLGRASGLTALERNIFINNWSDLTELEKLTMQQGVAARGNG